MPEKIQGNVIIEFWCIDEWTQSENTGTAGRYSAIAAARIAQSQTDGYSYRTVRVSPTGKRTVLRIFPGRDGGGTN